VLSVFATPQFRKDFAKVPKDIKLRADFSLTVLRVSPAGSTLKSKKLKIGKNLWRVRVGAYRLIYSFDSKSLILLRIRHRRDVYRKLS
jgi:mRNA interferase RelE/StbE